MAWSDWLTPDQTRQLLSSGSFDEVAIAATAKPRYAREFARLGAWVQNYEDHVRLANTPGVVVSRLPPEEFPRVVVPPAREQPFAKLVVAAMLEGDAAPAVPTEQPNLTRPLPPLPTDVNLFRFSSIQKGARLFDEGVSINGVAAASVFNLHDAPRLHWMLGRGFFRYDEGRLLPPDWRVGRVGKQYALRFLDEASWKWVDPAQILRGMGRTPG